jgi:hypothetical protein
VSDQKDSADSSRKEPIVQIYGISIFTEVIGAIFWTLLAGFLLKLYSETLAMIGIAVAWLALLSLLHFESRRITISNDGTFCYRGYFGLRSRKVNLYSLSNVNLSVIYHGGRLVLIDKQGNKAGFSFGGSSWRHQRQLIDTVYTGSEESGALFNNLAEKARQNTAARRS